LRTNQVRIFVDQAILVPRFFLPVINEEEEKRENDDRRSVHSLAIDHQEKKGDSQRSFIIQDKNEFLFLIPPRCETVGCVEFSTDRFPYKYISSSSPSILPLVQQPNSTPINF
jgi:hypothetical protein